MADKKTETTKKKNKRARKGSISGQMYTIAILPVILFALVITFAGIPFLSGIMHDMAEKELRNACVSCELLMNATYAGDYRLTGSDALYFYKGDTNITMDYSVIDSIKESTDLDISIFYKDTRILTTLTDENGSRMVGTGIASQIYDTVYTNGQEAFYNNTVIFGTPYYTYYIPLVSSHGNIQGIIAAARPSANVNKTIKSYILILAGIALILTGLMIFIVVSITKPMTKAIDSIFAFVKEASGGNETVTLDENLLRRQDELGEIGESVLMMQRSMRSMMESDPLTGLFNRRSAHRKLGPIIAKAKNSPDSFCICIGDIDFFKHVNDTYGHDAGDEVLIKVADIIREHMKNYGFVARWGGEEFLMVFDRTSLLMAENSLWGLLDKIRAAEIRYDNYVIKVTMSYGVSEWDKKENVDDLIRDADDKLYYAKNSGRNRVVSKIESENEGNAEDNELEQLLRSIGAAAPGNSSVSDGFGHFENLSAQELEDILSGKADEEAGESTSGEESAPITFSEDSYTDSALLGLNPTK
ncbi:MAG: diguanylate cyclase [Lachnospiraceae bacterium]|nr:diguanylate cyclase [Lachnospiraceae bacterium]